MAAAAPRRQAAVVNQDGTINSPTNPAPRGTYISIYATSQEFVPNAPPDGTLVSGPFPAPIQLRVNIAGNYPDQIAYESSSKISKDRWLPYSGLNAYPACGRSTPAFRTPWCREPRSR